MREQDKDKNNSFKKLLNNTKAPSHLKSKMKRNLDGNVGAISFLFKMLDLYVPKVLDIFVSATKENDPLPRSNRKDPASLPDAELPASLLRSPNHQDINFQHLNDPTKPKP